MVAVVKERRLEEYLSLGLELGKILLGLIVKLREVAGRDVSVVV